MSHEIKLCIIHVVFRIRGSCRRSSTLWPPRLSSFWKSQNASGVLWRHLITSKPPSSTCCAATYTVCYSWGLLLAATTALFWDAFPFWSGRLLPQDTSGSRSRFTELDPFISSRQILTNILCSCRSTILLDSRSLLRGRAVSDQAIAEALVSTMLLEDSSPRQALADFLLARKASMHQLLNQPQHGILPILTPADM